MRMREIAFGGPPGLGPKSSESAFSFLLAIGGKPRWSLRVACPLLRRLLPPLFLRLTLHCRRRTEMNTQATKLQAVENDLKQLMADLSRAMEKAQGPLRG
jgi:hypothetical protein